VDLKKNSPRHSSALVDNSLQLRRPQDQLIATLVSLVDNLRRLSSASSTTRHTDGQLAMLTKLHQRRSWRQVGKKNPITSATVSHARRTSTTTDAFNHHHHGYVKKYTSAQATPSGSSSTSRTTTPPPSKASTRIVASTQSPGRCTPTLVGQEVSSHTKQNLDMTSFGDLPGYDKPRPYDDASKQDDVIHIYT